MYPLRFHFVYILHHHQINANIIITNFFDLNQLSREIDRASERKLQLGAPDK
jgi:hypothetical protein